MPRTVPLPSQRLSLLRKFRRIMKWMAFLSIVVATIAVLLVVRGEQGPHIRMLIAAALGAGVSVLLAGALMSLAFLSASSDHANEAGKYEEDRKSE